MADIMSPWPKNTWQYLLLRLKEWLRRRTDEARVPPPTAEPRPEPASTPDPTPPHQHQPTAGDAIPGQPGPIPVPPPQGQDLPLRRAKWKNVNDYTIEIDCPIAATWPWKDGDPKRCSGEILIDGEKVEHYASGRTVIRIINACVGMDEHGKPSKYGIPSLWGTDLGIRDCHAGGDKFEKRRVYALKSGVSFDLSLKPYKGQPTNAIRMTVP